MIEKLLGIKKFFDGKKQMIASLVAAVPATHAVVIGLISGGTWYLKGMTETPEFAVASLGWIALFNALNNRKVRAENAVIIQNQAVIQQDVQAVTAPVK